MRPVFPPVDGDDWLGLTDAALPIGSISGGSVVIDSEVGSGRSALAT